MLVIDLELLLLLLDMLPYMYVTGSRSPTRRSSLRDCLCLLYYVLLVLLLDKQLLHRKQLLLLSQGLGLVGNYLDSLAMALDLDLVGLEEMLVKLLMLLLVLVVIRFIQRLV